MHEYSLVLALLEQVDAQVVKACPDTMTHRVGEGAGHTDPPSIRVRRVSVQVGELSGVVPELLRTAFEIASVKTRCHDAELVLDEVAARWVCQGCEREFAGGEILTCEACGAPARLVAGEELNLMQIELEVPDDV